MIMAVIRTNWGYCSFVRGGFIGSKLGDAMETIGSFVGRFVDGGLLGGIWGPAGRLATGRI